MKRSKKRFILGEGYPHPEWFCDDMRSTSGVCLFGAKTEPKDGSYIRGFYPRRIRLGRFRGKKIRIVVEVLHEAD